MVPYPIQTFKSADIDETAGATEIKASAGRLFGVWASNVNAAARYLKLYDATAVTIGTTVPKLTIAIPGASAINLTFGEHGIPFNTGIKVAATTGAADNNTGAPGAAEVQGNFMFM